MTVTVLVHSVELEVGGSNETDFVATREWQEIKPGEIKSRF